jgi:ComF family protein
VRCGAPFENALPLHGTGLCGVCRRGATEFDWGRGYGIYDGTLRRLIHLLKYDGMRPLVKPLAQRLAGLLAEAGPVDLIIPVPLDRRRERQRGFNQAALVAAEIGRLSGIPLDDRALRRIRATEGQTGLTHNQRRLNVRGAFQVRHREAVAGRNIALIDDVITTGATASACALTLQRAGAARVAVLALARARRRIVDARADREAS